MDTHTPYLPAVKYLDEPTPLDWPRRLRTHLMAGLGRQLDDPSLAQLRSLYRGAVRQVDDSIARVLEHLRSVDRLDRTAVVVAGDHGEEFQEHGHLAHYPKLYDELVHVPLIVRTPGRSLASVTDPVGLDAIPPTVMDALGVAPPSHFRGRSLLAPGPPPAEPVFSVTVRADTPIHQPIPRSVAEGELLVSVRTDRWTFIRHIDSGTRELFDRTRDPAEARDRWPEFADSPLGRHLDEAVQSHLGGLKGWTRPRNLRSPRRSTAGWRPSATGDAAVPRLMPRNHRRKNRGPREGSGTGPHGVSGRCGPRSRVRH